VIPALVVAVLLLAEVALVVFGGGLVGRGGGGLVGGSGGAFTAERIQAEGSTAVIGQVLFSTYLYPFEIASLLLLVAMVGAIVLSKKVS
jgi:NADH-quinone oxidoreductase subunit J